MLYPTELRGQDLQIYCTYRIFATAIVKLKHGSAKTMEKIPLPIRFVLVCAVCLGVIWGLVKLVQWLF